MKPVELRFQLAFIDLLSARLDACNVFWSGNSSVLGRGTGAAMMVV